MASSDLAMGVSVNIVSEDGEVFHVEPAVARGSERFVEMMELFDDDEDMPVINTFVPSQALSQAVVFMKMHHTTPMPAISTPIGLHCKSIRDVVPAAYASFVEELTTEQLVDLALVAFELRIPRLLTLLSSELAFMMHEMDLTRLKCPEKAQAQLDDVQSPIDKQFAMYRDAKSMYALVKSTLPRHSGDRLTYDETCDVEDRHQGVGITCRVGEKGVRVPISKEEQSNQVKCYEWC